MEITIATGGNPGSHIVAVLITVPVLCQTFCSGLLLAKITEAFDRTCLYICPLFCPSGPADCKTLCSHVLSIHVPSSTVVEVGVGGRR